MRFLLAICCALAVLGGCSTYGVGITIPIGGVGGVGVSVGSDGSVGGSVGVGRGGVGVSVGGSARLPQNAAPVPGTAASAVR